MTTSTATKRFLSTPSSAKNAAASMVLTKKENREKLSDNDRIKLQTAIITPLSPKFQLTSFSDSENQVGIVYNLGMRVTERVEAVSNKFENFRSTCLIM
jgi:phage tail sheath gpL-like